MTDDRHDLQQALRLLRRALMLVEEAGEIASFRDLQEAVEQLEYKLMRTRPDGHGP